MIHGRVGIALQHLDTIQVTTGNFVFCLFAVNASGGESVGSDAVLFELFEFPRDVRFLWSCLDRCPDALQNALSGARSSFSKMKMG
jgi:hypothetical protein